MPALQPGRTAGAGKEGGGAERHKDEGRGGSAQLPPSAQRPLLPARAAPTRPRSGSAGGAGHPEHQEMTRSHRDENELPCLVAARKRYPCASSLGDNISKLGNKWVTQSKLVAS